MYQVVKRDGKIVDFEINKIISAMQKAFDSNSTDIHPSVLEMLAIRVTADFSTKVKNGQITVEDIQDSVEKVLSESGYAEVAKAYILYRKKREDIRNAKSSLLNYQKVMDDYLRVNDWRVKENSTVSYSLGGLILSNSGAITANYWLNEIYDKEIGDAHRNCDLHLHDLSMMTPYCAGWNLKQLIQEGLGGVPGKITSKPAAHLTTLCNQMVNFLGILQNEWAGAQAFSSFDTYLAPFVKVDNLDYAQVKQAIQMFCFGVNTPSRWGCVDTDTEVLSVDGFKKYNELQEGDEIYVWVKGALETRPVQKVVIKEHRGKMHSYRLETDTIRYNQTVTPYHRMVVFKFDSATGVSSWNDCIITSDQVKSELERNPTLSIMLPCKFMTIGNNITPDTSKENIVPDNGYIYSSTEDRDNYQKHILETYGLLTYEKDGRIYQSKEPLIYYTSRNNNDCADNHHIGSFSEFDYDGIVWCPNTEAGTAVFRKDGSLFISGNSQAPFTNITLDWIVPDDQKNLPAIVGGKEMDFTYGDCQKEMDMVNKAFIEVMVEGDANGRGLQYPMDCVA